ncbi:TIGR03746 family integrating conjugative element protein [Salmonella enterica]|jgi:integrating conjugative element protein (TIGR03746 family)|uniref:PFL_4703 family integrating conjugative element protein n=1 Tax=Citrobacter TaxID=544 RepID=UPI000778B0F1|nr:MULTISPECIES: TIGR03746 family integrating conjugative element protein [Citrobacter]EAB4413183.1 TIGR03746 family integrating conjugative element protein [Salmonella enterica]EBG0125250.1 TIGR03746 family integrating conjugative element protein [Salmonella enterica subsp. enterica serovar Newport]EBK2665403.1 TIGR03746 family integrating conjugative element protein [Salmonella enterica subsp. enterica serovar Enteritidis]EKS6313228.1 TIGR03746 family integrating conjugative element protein [
MSAFKHALAARDAHIRTLHIALVALFLLASGMGFGWYSAPRQLTVYLPPDLRAASQRPWWEVPPATVYAFAFSVFQQINRWPTNGEADYPRNLSALRAYLTPGCYSQIDREFRQRLQNGELRDRVRGVYEIPGRGFSDKRVQILDRDNWIVTLDLTVDEYFHSEPVKRAMVRYPIKVLRYNIDQQKNPWGLALDCFSSPPQKLEAAKP